MANNIAGQTITGNSAPTDSPKTKVGRIVFDATAIVATDFIVITLGSTPNTMRPTLVFGESVGAELPVMV